MTPVSNRRANACSVRAIDSRATRLISGAATGRSHEGRSRLSVSDSSSTHTPSVDLRVTPVRIQPPQESVIVPGRSRSLPRSPRIVDLDDPRRDAPAACGRRRFAAERHVVLGVVRDRDDRAPNETDVDAKRIARARDDARRDHILLRRRRAGMHQAVEHAIERDARDENRVAPSMDQAGRNGGRRRLPAEWSATLADPEAGAGAAPLRRSRTDSTPRSSPA